jgi:hypothetical protein
LLLLSGCASRTAAVLKQAPPKPKGCQIEVFEQETDVKRPYEKLCLMSETAKGSAALKKAVERIKEQACLCGADAVVLKGETVGFTSTFLLLNTHRKLTVEATAIRWTDSPAAPQSSH